MLEDLRDARKAWLKGTPRCGDRSRREESDFLLATNHEGEQFDFHALRHTCGAWLAMSGVHPKVVQTVMRHSAITLTMDTYGHMFPGHEADAVGKLPGMFGNHPKALQATGTDDSQGLTAKLMPANRQQLSGETWPEAARSGESDSPRNDDAACRNVLPVNTLDDKRPDVAASGKSAPRWTRTNNPLIKSQMLCQLS